MEHDRMFKIIKGLEFDRDKIVFIDKDGAELFIRRPSNVSGQFKNYDINKNFQVWLRKGGRKFKPNHLRIFIDLNLKMRSRPELKEKILLAFDNIFYGADPDKEVKPLEKEHFEHSLNSIRLIANLMQLLLIEQEYCYYKESKYDPKNLFLQGWLREIVDCNPEEIDNLSMRVARGNAPASKYTNKENKKSKKYQTSLKPLWYLS